MSDDRISDRPRAGAGLNAFEALQLAACLDQPLSHYGLADTPENRKMLDKLKDIYADMRSHGYGIDIAT